MSASTPPITPATGDLFGVFRALLQAWSWPSWQQRDDRPTEASRSHRPPSEPTCVLVVDDNPVNLLVMSAMLASRGLSPLLAADGAEAVALASELHIDLVLMDLHMPILDGLDATAAIRRFEATASRTAVPVLAYSSTSLASDTLALHGMDGCLSKPCEDQEREACLVRWCPGYRPPT